MWFIPREHVQVPLSVELNLFEGIWPTFYSACGRARVCARHTVHTRGSQGAPSLPRLAQILAALRTLPCIRKHAGVGLESRSGLENKLLRPEFLLSVGIVLRALSLEATARSHPSCLSRQTCNELLEQSSPLLRDGVPRALALRCLSARLYMVVWHVSKAYFTLRRVKCNLARTFIRGGTRATARRADGDGLFKVKG